MKHIKTITTPKADAFTDLLNEIWRAWQEFRFAKKGDVGFF